MTISLQMLGVLSMCSIESMMHIIITLRVIMLVEEMLKVVKNTMIL